MREKIIEYGIAGAENAADLSKSISDAIEKGWQPIGGIAVGDIEVTMKNQFGETKQATQHFFQAVVKLEKIIRTLQ